MTPTNATAVQRFLSRPVISRKLYWLTPGNADGGNDCLSKAGFVERGGTWLRRYYGSVGTSLGTSEVVGLDSRSRDSLAIEATIDNEIAMLVQCRGLRPRHAEIFISSNQVGRESHWRRGCGAPCG